MADIDKIAIFIEVVRTGSFVEAARRLNKTATSISRYIQQLEAQLGTRLLQRTTRKLSLTMAGKKYYDRCAPAMENILQATEAVRAESEEVSGILRFTAPVDFFNLFQLDWIEEFLAMHPKVHLQCISSDSMLDLIDENIDLAVRGGDITDASLVVRKLADYHLGMVASPGYLEKYGMPGDIKQLSSHQCIISPNMDRSASWSLQGPDGEVEVEVSGNFSANTTKVMLNACQAGLGIALLPLPVMAQAVKSGQLIKVLPEYKRVSMRVNLVYVNRHHLPKAVSALLNFIVKNILLSRMCLIKHQTVNLPTHAVTRLRYVCSQPL